MSELISEVSRLLGQRRVTREQELAAARRTYSDGLVMEVGPPEAAGALIAAMDHLELDAADLAADHEVVRAVRQMETELASYERELERARAVSVDCERALSGANGLDDRRFDNARATLTEAVAARMKYELLISIVAPQVTAAAARAPRVFAGAPRRLAGLVRERRGPTASRPSNDATGSGDAAALLSGAVA